MPEENALGLQEWVNSTKEIKDEEETFFAAPGISLDSHEPDRLQNVSFPGPTERRLAHSP
jgi:hypothetical protein